MARKKVRARMFSVFKGGRKDYVVACTYLCPYCNNVTIESFVTPKDNLERIKTEGWYEPLECSKCGKITNVQAYPALFKE